MSAILSILAIAFLFYALIPILGAFVVRSHWRQVRKILHSSLYYSRELKTPSTVNKTIGSCRILGELEAIEGNDILWVKSENGRSVTVEMLDSHVYFMPPFATREEAYPHLLPVSLPSNSLEKVPWNEIFSLPEGTKMYISGELAYSNGRFHFHSGKDAPLMVLVYNEDPRYLIPRAIWCGRQNNEFWNFMTPWSLVAGILLLLIQSVYLFQNSGNYLIQFFCVSIALLPALLFLPPGVFLFNLYKRFWDTARRYRAERDLMTLALDPETGETTVPEKDLSCRQTRQPSGWSRPGDQTEEVSAVPGWEEEPVCFPDHPARLAWFCKRRAFVYESLSGIVFLGGLVLNYYSLWWGFNLFL